MQVVHWTEVLQQQHGECPAQGVILCSLVTSLTLCSQVKPCPALPQRYLLIFLLGSQGSFHLLRGEGVDGRAILSAHIVPLPHPWGHKTQRDQIPSLPLSPEGWEKIKTPTFHRIPAWVGLGET